MSNKSNKENTNLLVIGNGFDMFLGLNSSFKEFFGLRNANGIYNSLYDDIKQLIDKVSNLDGYCGAIDSNMSQYYDNFALNPSQVFKYIDTKNIREIFHNSDQGFIYNNKQLTPEEIKDIRDAINIPLNPDINPNTTDIKKESFNKDHSNFWSIYLILRKFDGDYDWSDIEDEIYKFIAHKNIYFYSIACFLYYALTNKQHQFDKNNEYLNYIINSNRLDKKQVQELYKNRHTFYINDLIDLLPNSDELRLNTYLIIYILLKIYFPKLNDILYDKNSKHYLNISYIKKSDPFIYELINDDSSDIYNGNMNLKFTQFCQLLYKYFKNQLSKLEYDLNNYLLNICVKNYYKTYGFFYSNISKELLHYMSGKMPFSLINFNYTKPGVSNYKINHNELNNSRGLMKFVRNIHGVLMNSNKYNDAYAPIIGISDYNIDMTNPAYIFTKNYRIMRLSHNNYGNVFDKHNYVQEVKFFGQSFDSADTPYLFDIFDHYKICNSDSDVKLVFYYVTYNNLSDDECATRQMNKVNTLFEQYCSQRHNSLNPKSLIHTLSFEGRLIITNLYDCIKNDRNESDLIKSIDTIKDINSKTSNKSTENKKE